jgi:hypothetical protein
MEGVLDDLQDGPDIAEDLRLGLFPRLVFLQIGELLGGGGIAELTVDAERERRDGSDGAERLEAAATEEARGGEGEGGSQSHVCRGWVHRW